MGSLSVSDRRLRKSITSERRPLMLKDFLLEDLSSCSSNGFKSFPRRQCCTSTTIRFLLEIDLKPREVPNSINAKQVLHRRSSSRAASKTVSALQRASDVVIKAVKQFPFPSVKSLSPSTSNKPRKRLLPRSISRKLLRRSFWWKTERVVDEGDNIRRWRSFRDLLQEHEDLKPSDLNTISSTVVVTSRVSTSTSSNSNSWADSEFTSDVSSSDNLESSTGNDVVVKLKKDISRKVKKKVDITVGEDSVDVATTTTTCSFSKGWPNEEKEQFSPVSVLDCPFEDEDEDEDEATSPFRRGLARTEGSKQKLKHQKIRRFENLQAQLEPVDLEKRMGTMSELDEDDNETVSSRHNNDDEESEEKARELVQLVLKTTTPSNKLVFMKSENLLFDFFRERMMEGGVVVKLQKEVLKVAEDWINGKQQKVLMGWEVKEGRDGYVKDMEKGGRWRNFDDEIHQLGLELEAELWNSLLDQLLLRDL